MAGGLAGLGIALGVQVVEGRGFNVGDTSNSRPVVVVNRAFARKYFDRAVGTELPGSPVNREVVGVVDDVKNGDVADAAQPELDQCAHQLTGGYQGSSPFVIVRTNGDPALVARAGMGRMRPVFAVLPLAAAASP